MEILIERDLDGYLNFVADMLLKNIPQSASVTIRLLEEEEKLVLKAAVGIGLENRAEYILISDSLAGEAIRQKSKLYIPDIRNDEKYHLTESVKTAKLVSLLIVPLFDDKKILGVIQIYTQEKYEFSKNDFDLTEVFAQSIAIHIKYARIASKRLDALLEISSTLQSTLILPEIMQIAVEKGSSALGVSRSVIYLLSEDGEKAEIVAGFPSDEHGIGKKFNVTGDYAALKQVILEKKHLLIKDPSINPLTSYVKELVSSKQINAVLFLPLLCNDEVIGVLVFDATKEKRFSEDDVNFALSMANIVSSRICNEYARQKIIKKGNLELLGQSASRVAHIIRNSMVPIGGFSARIKKEAKQILDPLGNILNDDLKKRLESLSEFSEIIRENTLKIEGILKDVLRFSRPLSLKTNSVNVIDFIEEISRRYTDEFKEKNINFFINYDLNLKDFVVNIDKIEMTHAIDDLMRNAIYAVCEPDFMGGKKIGIEIKKTRKIILISVINNGKPIPQNIINEIFEPFFTLKPDGTGLGLANSRTIIEAHDGKIEAESNEQETRFTIKLPI